MKSGNEKNLEVLNFEVFFIGPEDALANGALIARMHSIA